MVHLRRFRISERLFPALAAGLLAAGPVATGLLVTSLIGGCSGSRGRDASLDPVPEAALRADRRLFTGDDSRALSILDEAAQADPGSFHVLYRLGVLRLFTDPAAAAAHLDEAARVGPTHPGPPYFRALLRLRTGDLGSARPWLDRAEALREARVAARYAARDTSDALRAGLAAVRTRRFREAIVAFRNAGAGRPDDPALIYLEALALQRGGNPSAALPVVDRALRLRPRFPDAQALRGLCLFDLERRDEARAISDELLAADPDLADGLYLAGRVSLGDNDYQESFLFFWHAILEDPMVAEYYTELGQNLIVFGMRDLGSRFLQFMEWTAQAR